MKRLITFCLSFGVCMPAIAEAPLATKKPHTHKKHGVERQDPWFWLNDRENPEVIDYLKAENAWTERQMQTTADLQKDLFEEMKSRIKQTDQSAPVFENGYWYYRRYEEGKDYPIYCRRSGSREATEQIILDVNKIAEGHDFMQVARLNVTDDGNTLVWAQDSVGRRIYQLHFKDLKTGNKLPLVIEGAAGSNAWSADNKTLFYTSKDSKTLRSDRVWRRDITAKSAKEVFYEKDETFYAWVSRSQTGRYIYLGSWSTLSSEVQLMEANTPESAPKVFLKRQKDHLYEIAEHGDGFYVKSNSKAPNFKILHAKNAKQDQKDWQTVLPHRADAFISDFLSLKSHLVTGERKDGINRVKIRQHTNLDQEQVLEFDESIYNVSIGENPEYDTKSVRIDYNSMTTPTSQYDVNLASGKKTLVKQAFGGVDYDPQEFKTERLYARADDGTAIPMSIVYKKSLKKDGPQPLLLYAYGSYGSTIPPYFSPRRVSLLNRGVIFVIAHVRGSQIFGKPWYEDGKLLNKKNTFTDYINCAEHLIQQKMTSPQQLLALGGSAGGLLMGAVINMRPDLFQAVIAAVPFVDIVTTMLDDTIPLTTFEYDEWGNPNNKEYFDYMLSYSPYDNVSKQEYPALLVTTGLHDSQVQYWEPAKWVAKLRRINTSTEDLLLKTDMSAGHGGKTGRFNDLHDTAFEYAFFLNQLEKK